MSPIDDATLRRCYSLYLWAFTVAASGGVVNFDLDSDAERELGWKTVLLHQHAVSMGAVHGRTLAMGGLGSVFTLSDFSSRIIPLYPED